MHLYQSRYTHYYIIIFLFLANYDNSRTSEIRRIRKLSEETHSQLSKFWRSNKKQNVGTQCENGKTLLVISYKVAECANNKIVSLRIDQALTR